MSANPVESAEIANVPEPVAQASAEAPVAETVTPPDVTKSDDAVVKAAEPASPPAMTAPVRRAAGAALPFAAAVALAAGLVGVGGIALRGSAPEAAARLNGMEQTLAALTAEIAALRANTEALASQPKPAASLGPIVSRLDVLGEAIERAQKDQQARIATLVSGERGSDKALGEKLAALTGRLERIERAVTTGSIPATMPAAAGAQPLPPKPQEAANAKVPGFVLREVDDGIAVIEDRRGAIHELMRGEILPGVGRIQKIERRGNAWVAVTERGIIAGR